MTYDWTTAGGPAASTETLAEICQAEVDGVLSADRVIFLMPGGRGTHVELGLALASGKPVSMWSETESVFTPEGRTSVFYHHRLVRRHAGGLDEFITELTQELAKQMWYGQCLVCGTCYEKESELRPLVDADGRSHGAFCPECREHELVAPGVVHFEPAAAFAEDRTIRPPWTGRS